AAALAAGRFFTLTSCGSFDASGYVKAALDSNIHGEFEEYAEFVDISLEEAEQDYNDNLDSSMQSMASFGMSEEMTAKYRTLFADLMKKTKYEVGEATKNDDGSYTVPVTVTPITNVFDGLMDEAEKELMEYALQFVTADEAPTDDEITAYTVELLYNLLSERVSDIQYGDPQQMEVTVSPDENKAYSISADDMESLTNALVDMGDLAN
ncbi:MAG: hypothetical protein ACI3XW_11020, partial [Butyricicoccus sp.]